MSDFPWMPQPKKPDPRRMSVPRRAYHDIGELFKQYTEHYALLFSVKDDPELVEKLLARVEAMHVQAAGVLREARRKVAEEGVKALRRPKSLVVVPGEEEEDEDGD